MQTHLDDSALKKANAGVGSLLLAASMSLVASAPACADEPPEQGSLAIKQLDYFDYQSNADRIRVKATALKLIAPFAGSWMFGSSITTDAISGASPAYHGSGLKKMQDRRNAADMDLTRYYENSSYTLGLNYSHEEDYISKGLMFQANFSSVDRNTTYAFAAGASNDVINPANQLVQNEKKTVRDVLLSVSQVLTPVDIVQLGIGFSRGRGYFSDPYKVFDERPRERDNKTWNLRWNHHWDALDASTRFAYRYYLDSWGIKAHTFNLDYVQNLSNDWTLTPSLRLHSQTAADFYVDAGPADFPFPPNPPEGAIHYSEDHRVSGFGAVTYGFKLSKKLGEDWLVDLKYEQYRQAAGLKLFGTGSLGLPTFYARTIQLGLSRQF
ncbi:DUF3570 domain-containing protein [Undibacterium fentianense]|uniref:DUF3570 domain-containing protein n=1 Tax=Undibacterium fentianense TaxID=2828728 RepID=A0A941IFS2_9BURK|nr:DUF3570 domain-containing protein [Undibacterium fentianense]MBR7799305.1 DUF3570 domain-containing protein [Undibacterium fentianense]